MRQSESFVLLVLSLVFGLIGCAGPTAPAGQGGLTSGLQKGEDIQPWNPIHVAGPNAGTNACPVCTYGALPAVVIFTRDGANASALASKLEVLVKQNVGIKLKGFLIVTDSTPEHLKQMASDLAITQIGICYPDPQERDHDFEIYEINPAATNTIMVYKNFKIAANFVNLDAGDFQQVTDEVAKLQ